MTDISATAKGCSYSPVVAWGTVYKLLATLPHREQLKLYHRLWNSGETWLISSGTSINNIRHD